jgi:cytidine deaminase
MISIIGQFLYMCRQAIEDFNPREKGVICLLHTLKAIAVRIMPIFEV